MIYISQIPLFKYIEVNHKLPNVYFSDLSKKHSKKYALLYSLLSIQYPKQILTAENYYISFEALNKLQEYLNRYEVKYEKKHDLINTHICTLTLPSSIKDIYYTHVFISSKINNSQILDILTYNNINLYNWLSGVFYSNNEIHISASYNLDDENMSYVLSMYDFIKKLKSLNYFEQITATDNNYVLSSSKETGSVSNIIHLDLSNTREYLIPSITRREHYRWQLCGPGRSILRNVKVQSTRVKSHIRKGKRI